MKSCPPPSFPTPYGHQSVLQVHNAAILAIVFTRYTAFGTDWLSPLSEILRGSSLAVVCVWQFLVSLSYHGLLGAIGFARPGVFPRSKNQQGLYIWTPLGTSRVKGAGAWAGVDKSGHLGKWLPETPSEEFTFNTKERKKGV